MADLSAIAQNLRLITLRNSNIENLIIAKVLSVTGTLCDCQPIDDGLAEMLEVRLTAEGSAENFILFPKVDSIVGIMPFSDLETTDYMVVMFSELDTIHLRGDQYGGLTKIEDLVTKLNNLESDLNNLKTAIGTTWVPVPNDGGAALKAAAASWAAATLTPTTQSEIENTNVLHG